MTMMHSRKLGAIGAAVVCMAAGIVAIAQETTVNQAPSVNNSAAEIDNLLSELAAEAPEQEPAKAAAEPEAAAEVPAAEPVAAAEALEPKPENFSDDKSVAEPKNGAKSDIDIIREVEENRIKANELQIVREIEAARDCAKALEYFEAARHYGVALKLARQMAGVPGIGDKTRECETQIGECLYQAAWQDYRLGRRDRAIKIMEKARNFRHPQANDTIQQWQKKIDIEETQTDVSEIKQERNDDDYKARRDKNSRRLKRANQLFGLGDLSEALNECETVLKDDPYNVDALRIRGMIQKRRQAIYQTERKAARDGMIADVDEAWRPVYAVNAREVENVKNTRKSSVGPDDAQRTLEQSIIKRMKDMRLPAISFKPPATIIDAVEFFRTASIDYDDEKRPIEQRGFNFTLRTPEALQAAPAAADNGGGNFGDDPGADAAPAGLPVIPIITASDISFYDALKLVCESVQYKFKVQGPMVIVMHKDATVEEMVTRSYPVMSAFVDKVNNVSDDLRNLGNSKAGGGGFGRNAAADDAGAGDEPDWKRVFTELGVQWPEGSSIFYMKATGKLRVRNTYENLAELEKALIDLNAEPKLIEIEARFVEVCQEDLNSLGFEWILNSDYSLNLGSHVSRALGLRSGVFGSESGTTSLSRESSTSSSSTSSSAGGVVTGGSGTTSTLSTPATTWKETVNTSRARTTYLNSNGASWIHSDGPSHHNRNIGINGFGGSSDYTSGQRYLSTLSNHISGEGYQTNDQFMRFNAFLGGADLSMILHMLSQRSDTDLLSAPKVLTRPGEEAIIEVVTEYRYPTDYDVQLQSSSSSSSYGGSGGQSAILAVVEPQQFEVRKVGVMLDVTPSLTDDGNLIDLKLNTQVVDEPTWKNYGMRIPFTGNNSALQNFEGIGGIFEGLSSVLASLGTGLSETLRATFAEAAVSSATTALDSLTQTSDNITYYDAPMEQPFFHVRSIESSVSVYPGATIVMGGLITEQRKAMDDKIPILGDLPFIGRLFRSHSEMTNKRNLLVFVTTRLVDVRGRNVDVGTLEVKNDGEVTAAPSGDDQ